jgi:hypothetical protein
MNGISVVPSARARIYRIDYRSRSVPEMLRLLVEIDQLISAHNEPVMVMSLFNDESFTTSQFMRQAEAFTQKHLARIAKQAIVGQLSLSKKIILQGYNQMFNRNFPAFATEAEALAYFEA